MNAIRNIDDLFRDLLERYGELKEHPNKIPQTLALANVAAKASKIAEIKFMVSVARGQAPDDPMFGSFSSKDIPGVMRGNGKVSAKELAYREFRAQIKNRDVTTEG
jgi:hypothetical protein